MPPASTTVPSDRIRDAPMEPLRPEPLSPHTTTDVEPSDAMPPTTGTPTGDRTTPPGSSTVPAGVRRVAFTTNSPSQSSVQLPSVHATRKLVPSNSTLAPH